jgi:hypothetical protein
MPFDTDEPPTRPEGFRREIRLMAERVLAAAPADIAVLRMLRAGSTESDEAMMRYAMACLKFVERLLG